ncbi:FMN-dependent NADH-azoreductase [Pseudovibrio axinellae]|uniref:FMN dependent NADH:quinone oxidoreductase n=1 Tax=Pseudovibrio axinellae TaxID=989403 RepID=A0A161XHW8_9HYPH|nr:NAD(P)H-dependent oxidoreductase [Pseudovibrio axinellae]KZL21523.1 FMN-dependent NADH-azoreductase [Pseudovibrio axinellae]SER08148.1 FMN-dependent NADH-azoreductase [Pseudovibrio axinellae]
MKKSILNIQSSAATATSITRQLSDELIAKISGDGDSVVQRDLNEPISFVDESWIGAAYTPEEKRSDEQKSGLALSDALIAELKETDVLVIGAPIYNFSVPAVLKAWVDQIARVGVTFNYTEYGPEGLLTGKKAYIVVATGGVPVDSPADFAVPYLKQVLAFVGIKNVEVIAAEGVSMDRDGAIEKARNTMAGVTAVAA